MTKILVLILLTGCSTAVPVAQKFPDVPSILMEPAPMLTPMDPSKRNLSDLLENANDNYGTYYTTREKLSAWQNWYNQQKKIFNQ